MSRAKWVLLWLVTSSPLLAQADPFNGAWKLNPARSTFAPGTAARNETVTYKIAGDEETFIADGITATGGSDVFKYICRYDGKECPGTTVIAEEQRVRLVTIDARTRERFTKLGTRPVSRIHSEASADRTRLTVTTFTFDDKGAEWPASELAFNRQSPAQADPFTGSWRLNAAASKFVGIPVLKSQAITITTGSGGAEVFHSQAVTADDTEEVTDYTASYDGREYAAKFVTTDRRMVVLRKVDARTRERISRNRGQVVGLSRRTVSADGKTLTTTIYRMDEKGKETPTQTRVFEKLP